ncbi:unnamed protein product [Spirodela intermedia]|uniref:HTH myb-type domain-containing protein n=1 Tax=Spirodela intermedia TaxID=51605 RepID=A0A7I8KQC9_SPIIN|nr:unnamed protein product [Spirodela intermedia]
MGCLPVSELSLELRPPSTPRATVAPFLSAAAAAAGGGGGPGNGKATELDEYLRELEEERRKIEVFRRELPLYVIILNDVIGDLKEELAQRKSRKKQEDDGRMNWMSSTQLCTALHSGVRALSPHSTTDTPPPQPFLLPLAASSAAEKLAPPRSSSGLKPRRYWSPELHQRFVDAVEHLGGWKVATPKKVKQLMKVEGLTNDEIKSHLQKFRLHAQRSAAAPSSANPAATAGRSSWKERERGNWS